MLGVTDIAATVAAVAIIETEIATIETEITGLDAEIATLNNQTLYQSTSSTLVATRFNSSVRTSDGTNDNVILYASGDITNTGTLTSGTFPSSNHVFSGGSFTVNCLTINLNGIVTMTSGSLFSQW